MASLRSPETAESYRKYLKSEPGGSCSLCEKVPIKEFAFWKIVENSFPYDKISKTHHMLMPTRHVSEDFLSEEERKELRDIKISFVQAEYDWIIESTHKNRSIPEHFHLHLLTAKV